MKKKDDRAPLGPLDADRVFEFDASTWDRLAAAYLRTKGRAAPESSLADLNTEAETFVDALEDCADLLFKNLGPRHVSQKKRRSVLDSMSVQADRMATAMFRLDWEATSWLQSELKRQGNLGGWPTTAADETTTNTDTQPNVLNLAVLLRALALAAREASRTLPPHDFQGNEPRLMAAGHLLEIFRTAGIESEFSASRSGLAYLAMTEICALAGIYKGDPVYWLRKACNQKN